MAALASARRGIESGHHLGRHRWVVEFPSWLSGRRRLTIRYERKASNFRAFTAIACADTSSVTADWQQVRDAADPLAVSPPAQQALLLEQAIEDTFRR